MAYVEGQDRHQIMLLPESIEDFVSEDNPVRAIDAFVDGLDLNKLGFTQAEPSVMGRPAYNPRDLLKLYIYGYFNKIRSSRKLMKECQRNIELFYLLRRLTPDFRTIADFRKNNAKALKSVFREFVGICLAMNLYQKELLAIDGSKFRAVNSKANSYNQDTLIKKLLRIEENITRYFEEMDQLDHSEPDEQKVSKSELQQRIAELRERKGKYENFLSQLEQTGETQILTTDPQARVMQSKDGFHCYYNVQTAVDAGSHLIAEYEVTNHCNDQGLLQQVADQTRGNLALQTIAVVADKGYESRRDIENCVKTGIIPHVIAKYDQDERIHTLPYEEADISEELRQSTRSEDIQTCLKAGVLPACYEGSGISVEIQGQTVMSCFVLNDDGTVTCPMGQILRRTKNRGEATIFGSREACRECPNKCTPGTTFKTVSFGPNTRVVPVMMYGNSQFPPRPIPPDLPVSSFNHSLDRGDLAKRKVQLRIRSAETILKQRMCLAEHPFGTVKWHHDARYLLCRGLEKTTGELGLSFLVYNLKRAINLVGVPALVSAMKSC
jgi:transposase